MSSRLPESGQASALVLIGLVVLALPVGLALAQGLTSSKTTTASAITPTLPPLNMPATSTPTATPTPDGSQNDDDNETGGNTPTGQSHFVNAELGPVDGVTSEKGCSGANYTSIQAAVDAADPGDTVAVCPGTYTENVEVSTTNLTITAADRLTQAAGDATITNAAESAVWINAAGVTLRGFNISVGEEADYAIEVGGKRVVIEDNTVESYGVGIFLSDGHRETGECKSEEDFDTVCKTNPPVDPALGPATGGRVLNNSVTADNFRIWVDADRGVIQHNFATELRVRDDYQDYNSSIISSGNDTVIRGNTIQTTRPVMTEQSTQLDKAAGGIKVGKNPFVSHNNAYDNRVVANAVDKPRGIGVITNRKTAGTSIQGNSITSTLDGVNVHDAATVRNNTISAGPKNCIGVSVDIGPMTWAGEQQKNKGVFVLHNTLNGANRCLGAVQADSNAVIAGNTIRNYVFSGISFDVCVAGTGRIIDNQISGTGINYGAGISISSRKSEGCTNYAWYRFPDMAENVVILNNEITDNREEGISIGNHAKPGLVKIHDNLILNNGGLGINNHNASIIVNATENIWACGGPSSGFDPLADPYTGRLANGSGDAISGGNGSTRNGHPISNVHFDPFRVQNPSSCSGSQPTATETQTPTSTPTPTGMPTKTPTATAPSRFGNGTGEMGGNGTGGTGGNGSGGDGNAVATGSTDRKKAATPFTATPSPPPTSTSTPPPTVSPTPRVEPGFGVVIWVVGLVIFSSLLALRCQRGLEQEETNE